MTWLESGTNLIALQCDDAVGSANLDKVTLALYTTNVVSGLEARSMGGGLNGITMDFDTLPRVAYALEWKSNLTAATWQPLTNFTGSGATVQVDLTNGLRQGFCRINIIP